MNEKIYFKRFASRHIPEGNNYVKLFDALDRMQEYDKKELKRSLPARILSDPASARYYLHKLMLQSLRAYHAGSSCDIKISEGLHNITILFRKGLFHDALLLLEKIKRLAARYERSLLMVEIINWEKRLVLELDDIAKIESLNKELYDRSKQQLKTELLSQECNALGLYVDTFSTKYGKSLQKEQLNQVTSFYKRQLPRMQELEHMDLALEARLLLYHCHNQYSVFINNLHAAHKWSGNQVRLLEKNFHRAKERPLTYITVVSNYLIGLIHFKKYDEALNMVNKLEAFPAELPSAWHKSIEFRVFCAFSLKLDIYIQSGRFQEGIREFEFRNIPEQIKGFEEGILKTYEMLLYYNIAFLYFAVGRFSKALKWINALLNKTDLKGNRISILCYARTLNLLIHYELGNSDLLEPLVKSSIQYLKKQNSLHQCENLFMNSVLKIARAKEPEKTRLFKQLKKDLASLKQKAEEKETIQTLELDVWLDSKISGKTFEEAFQVQVGKR